MITKEQYLKQQYDQYVQQQNQQNAAQKAAQPVQSQTAAQPAAQQKVAQPTVPAAAQQTAAPMQQPSPYTSQWQGQIDSLMGQIMNRDKFTYDLDGDMLYQNYRNQYQNLGRLAMEDTMGQAAGLTGGYGSTYSQNAGQQAYDAYLRQLNDIVPSLYDRARSAYDAEGNAMAQQYAMLGDREAQDYSRWGDQYNQWLTERQRQDELDQLEWNRNYQAQQDAYAKQQDSFNRMYALMSQYGYNPTDAELSASGLTRSQADAILAPWIAANTPASSSGGGGGGSYKAPSGWTTEDIIAFQQANGLAADGIWGAQTSAAYNAEARTPDAGTVESVNGATRSQLRDALIAGGMSATEANKIARDPEAARRFLLGG